MYVHGSRTTEVVVAPHFLQKLSAGENASWVLRQVLEQFKFLERQIKNASAHLGGVTRFVNGDRTAIDFVGHGFAGFEGQATGGNTNAGFDFGWASGIDQDIVDAPIGGQASQATLSSDDKNRRTHSGSAQEPAQTLGGRKFVARVNQDHIGVRSIHQGRRLCSQYLDLVTQESQRWENLGGSVHP